MRGIRGRERNVHVFFATLKGKWLGKGRKILPFFYLFFFLFFFFLSKKGSRN